MPYYAKSEDWLHQSALLLQARPSTTRITTRYHLKPARRTPKPAKSSTTDSTTQTQPPPPQEGKETKPPRGHLVLKTFDPHSGVTLKYKTSKAAEVMRLVQMLGTLGKRMAGVEVNVPEPGATSAGQRDEVMADAGVGGEGEGVGGSGSGVQTPTAGGGGQAQGGQQGGGGGGGGKGKKKRGKR